MGSFKYRFYGQILPRYLIRWPLCDRETDGQTDILKGLGSCSIEMFIQSSDLKISWHIGNQSLLSTVIMTVFNNFPSKHHKSLKKNSLYAGVILNMNKFLNQNIPNFNSKKVTEEIFSVEVNKSWFNERSIENSFLHCFSILDSSFSNILWQY